MNNLIGLLCLLAALPESISRQVLWPVHDVDAERLFFGVSTRMEFVDPLKAVYALDETPTSPEVTVNLLRALKAGGYRAGLPFVRHHQDETTLRNLKLLAGVVRNGDRVTVLRRLVDGDFAMVWLALDRTDRIQLLSLAVKQGRRSERICFDWGAANPVRELFYELADAARRERPQTLDPNRFPEQLVLDAGPEPMVLHFERVVRYDAGYGRDAEGEALVCLLDTVFGREQDPRALADAWDLPARTRMLLRAENDPRYLDHFAAAVARAQVGRPLATLVLADLRLHYFESEPGALPELLVLRQRDRLYFSHDLPENLYQFFTSPRVKHAVAEHYR